MLRHRTQRGSLIALLTLLFSACFDSPNDGVSEREARIDRVSEALGGFTQLWNGSNGETPLYVDTNWTAFKHVSSGCDQVDVISTPGGTRTAVAALPTCGTVTAAAADGTLFVGTSARAIYGMQPVQGPGADGGIAGTPGAQNYDWQLVVSTSGTNISKIVVDTFNIYWQDSSGIYRAPRAGGTGTKIGFSNRTLLAADGSVLWVQRDDGGGQWSLRTITKSTGVPELTVATNNMPVASGFFSEINYAWWVENGAADGYNRLRRLTKADGTITTMKVSNTLTYSLPMRDGTLLYYIDKNTSNGAVTMRRHNVTTGVVTSANVGVLDVLHMALGPSVYFTAQTSASPVRYNLQSGTL